MSSESVLLHRSPPLSPEAPLRPYPELSSQKEVEDYLWNLADVLHKISRFISFPFQKISNLFSPQLKKTLVSKSICISSHLFIKTETETFDHKCYYVVREGKIYFKPIAAPVASPWKEIPFNQKAIRISADGDNLIALDESKRVYYAKTHSIEFHINECGWDIASFDLEWRKHWFNMDLISSVVNFFKPPALYAMEGARAIAISHRGKDSLYYIDMAGKKHPDPIISATTLYMLDPSGTRIFFADPWLPNKFHNEITGPEEGRFIAESMDASASTLFLMQRAIDPEGREVNKMYTRYADYDSIGANPAFPATYDRDNKTPLVRILPGEDWLEQPSIPLEENAHLTKRITILQTGRGQAQRQVRVEGTDSEGRTGYYVKMIYESRWAFQRTDHFIPRSAFLPEQESGPGLQKGPQVAHDYVGRINTKQGTFPAVLRNFSSKGLNERNLHTRLEVMLPSGRTVSYPLYARRGMAHLLGLKRNDPNWTLVATDKTALPLNNRSVEIAKRADHIAISGKGITGDFPLDRRVSPAPPSPPRGRFFTRLASVFFGGIMETLKLSWRFSDRIFSSKDDLKAQERFRQSLLLQDTEDTKKVMRRLVAKDASLAPEPMVRLLLEPSVSPHLRKLMNGANALIEDESGEWFQQLKKIKGAVERPCSHMHKKGTCYGLETPLFGEVLFWIDLAGKLRLQFEAHSLRSLFKIYCHFCDFLKYKSEGRQQGMYGTSKHTDAAPLIIRVNRPRN